MSDGQSRMCVKGVMWCYDCSGEGETDCRIDADRQRFCKKVDFVYQFRFMHAV